MLDISQAIVPDYGLLQYEHMRVSLVLFLFSLFGNFWIYRLLHLNFFACLIAVMTTLYLFSVFRDKFKSLKPRNKKRLLTGQNDGPKYWVLLLLFVLLLFLQWQTTKTQSLTNLDNDEQRVVVQRLKEYPPTYIQVGSKTKWLPFGHWFEERQEFLVFQRMEKNLFENLDTNQFFFATHPFERQGFDEFEKFPYLFLPFFVVGLVTLLQRRFWTSQNDELIYFASFLFPLILLGIIGNENRLGPFSLFPFFVVSNTFGLITAYRQLHHRSKIVRKIISVGFILMFLLTFLQMIIYATY